MKQSKSEIDEKIIENRLKYGDWWPFSKNKFVNYFEEIGKVVAFAIRGFPSLRKRLGAESFTWGRLIGSFLWYRLWVFIMAGHTNESAFYNPFIYDTIPAAFLSLASYIFLILGMFYKLNDGIQFMFLDKDIDQYTRGESFLFYYEFNNNHPLNKEMFRLVFLEPLLIGLIGLVLIMNNWSVPLGTFFLSGAWFYSLDEFIYNSAKNAKMRKTRNDIRKGKRDIKKHEELDTRIEDDDNYNDD